MRSIQSIIFIRLFAIIIILFGVVSGVAYYLSNEAIRQFVVTDASTSLSFVINNVKNNYESDLIALDQLAQMKGFLPFDEPTARILVADFLKFPSIYNTVHMYKADGELLFAEKRDAMGTYTPKSNFRLKDPHFVALAEKVLNEKRSMASELLFSKNGTLYQTYVTPVFSDEKKEHILGILSGGVFPRLHHIDYLLKGLKLGKDNFILITDTNSHFITSDGITEKDTTTAIQDHSARAVQRFYSATPDPRKNDPLIDFRVKVGSSSFIVISLPIDTLKLIVTMGVNEHRIDEKSRELSYRLLVALVIGLLLSLFASIFLGDRLAKPFRQIAEAINEINKGNFAARIQYKGDDEIGYLSKTINALAEKIQKSEYLGNLWSTEEESEKQQESDSETPQSKS